MVAKIDLRFSRFAILHCPLQRTSHDAERAARPVHVRQQIVKTAPAHDFGRRIPAQSLRSAIPKGDSAIRVHEINAIVKVFYKIFVKQRGAFSRRTLKMKHFDRSQQIGHFHFGFTQAAHELTMRTYKTAHPFSKRKHNEFRLAVLRITQWVAHFFGTFGINIGVDE